MRWNWKYAGITLLLFIIEIIIAVFIDDRFIRPFIGDLLVVVLLYMGFRTILKANPTKIAIGVYLFAITIEFAQYFNIVDLLSWQNNNIARIIIGSTFDWLDILAYTLGIIIVYWLDAKSQILPVR